MTSGEKQYVYGVERPQSVMDASRTVAGSTLYSYSNNHIIFGSDTTLEGIYLHGSMATDDDTNDTSKRMTSIEEGASTTSNRELQTKASF